MNRVACEDEYGASSVSSGSQVLVAVLCNMLVRFVCQKGGSQVNPDITQSVVWRASRGGEKGRGKGGKGGGLGVLGQPPTCLFSAPPF